MAASAITRTRPQRPKKTSTRRQRLRDAVLRIGHLRNRVVSSQQKPLRTMGSAEQDTIAEVQTRSAHERGREHAHTRCADDARELRLGKRASPRDRTRGIRCALGDLRRSALRYGRDDDDTRRCGGRVCSNRDGGTSKRHHGEQRAQPAVETSRHAGTMATLEGGRKHRGDCGPKLTVMPAYNPGHLPTRGHEHDAETAYGRLSRERDRAVCSEKRGVLATALPAA